jgi:hypothetical protein
METHLPPALSRATTSGAPSAASRRPPPPRAPASIRPVREDGTKVFDGVIVISDRTVLDGQLQKAIEQLETVAGVFAPITTGSEGSKSKQLAAALLKGHQIIGA